MTHKTAGRPIWIDGRTVGLLGMLLLVAAAPVGMRAQAAAQPPGCSLAKQVYTCDKAAFHKALKEARTVAIEVKPRDRMARAQVKDLVEGLGKTVQPADTPADLTFLLVPIESDGIEMGPADRELGSLRVYAPGVDGQRGALLWAETFRGQPDLTWPAVVHSLIQQFQAQFEHH